MTRPKGNLLLFAGLIALGVVAAAVVVGIAISRDDGEDKLRYPGRVAVQSGCGVTHFFQDGTDQKEICLADSWDAVSLAWKKGDKLAWDTRSQGIRVGDENGENEVNYPAPLGANYSPSLSPDGERIAFLHSARDDGRYDIWVGDVDAANAEQVTTTRNISDVSWAPRGDWLAYVQNWSDETLEGQIALVRPDGTEAHVLTKGDAPEWAPDGEHLVYVHNRNVWTIGRDGKNAKMIVPNGHVPAWSRDGEQIAFMRADRCSRALCPEHVFLAFTNGTDVRKIGPEFPEERTVLWLRDPVE